MFKKPIVYFDDEYTAWEGSWQRNWNGPGEYREIVQLGAIVISPDSEEMASFNCYVKPVRNPNLPDYFKTLTGISQEEVDLWGVSLERCLKLFARFTEGFEMWSWGGDEGELIENCELLGIPFPIERNRFHDIIPVIEPWLVAEGVDHTQYVSGTLLNAFGKKGLRAHNGINDCRNVLVVLQELRSRGRF